MRSFEIKTADNVKKQGYIILNGDINYKKYQLIFHHISWEAPDKGEKEREDEKGGKWVDMEFRVVVFFP